jgi:hypothetical protein
MSEGTGGWEEVTGQVSDLSWLDDESVPASWLHDPGEDPGQYGEPADAEPPAGAEPSGDAEPPAEPPWWLSDEFLGTPEQEHAAWLAGLPADIRADYLDGPYTGAGEAFGPGFTHHDDGGPSGAGFAAGGALDQMPPGPWLAQALADATQPGYKELNDSEQIGVLCGWQRQSAWAQAGLAAAAVAVARRRDIQAAQKHNRHLAEHVPDELAAALALTSLSAGRLLAVAAGLDRLPPVAAALSCGQIDWPKACVFVDELSVLDDQLARQIAAGLLAGGRLTTAELRARLRRAVLAADPDAARRRQNHGRKDTRVEVWAEPSGNKALAGRELAPADAIAADAQLTADARWLRRRGAPGTLAELRAAAFIARLSGRDLAALLPSTDASPDASPDPEAGGALPAAAARPHAQPAHSSGIGGCIGGGPGPAAPPGGTINLTLPLTAYAGLDDSPGEAAGHGTIDADTGRDLAALLAASPAARWCLTLTGPGGRAVAHACARPGHPPQPGSPGIRWAAGLRHLLQFLETSPCTHPRQAPGYTWPAALRHLIEARQRTCAAPGCRRPARRCDIDHTTPYDAGGRTCECNGAPLCRCHHRCKQTPGWHLTQDQPGHMTWQLPGGRQYQTTGDPY